MTWGKAIAVSLGAGLASSAAYYAATAATKSAGDGVKLAAMILAPAVASVLIIKNFA